jgi:hypothetical protein
MASDDGRTVEQIRAEIDTERARLDQAVSTFVADIKRVSVMAGSGVGGLGSLLFLLKLRGRRRR